MLCSETSLRPATYHATQLLLFGEGLLRSGERFVGGVNKVGCTGSSQHREESCIHENLCYCPEEIPRGLLCNDPEIPPLFTVKRAIANVLQGPTVRSFVPDSALRHPLLFATACLCQSTPITIAIYVVAKTICRRGSIPTPYLMCM